jgi:hypothetical protein
MHRYLRAGVLGLGLGGCGIFRVSRVEPFEGVPAREALARARNGNWRVRARAGVAQPEGRVSFLTDSTVEIGGSRVRLVELTELDRWSATDLGGKPVGAIVGGVAGVVLGSLWRSYYEYGQETWCTVGCTLRIYMPSIGVTGLPGAGIGSVVHPPAGDWVAIWKR